MQEQDRRTWQGGPLQWRYISGQKGRLLMQTLLMQAIPCIPLANHFLLHLAAISLSTFPVERQQQTRGGEGRTQKSWLSLAPHENMAALRFLPTGSPPHFPARGEACILI